MSKILLIRPFSKIPITNFPLGLMYIASSLEKAGHEVKILDLRFKDSGMGDINKALNDFIPDTVGIGAMTTEDAGLRKCLQVINESKIEKPMIVVGGPHASTYYREILKYPGVDCVVFGEGEMTMRDLVDKRCFDGIKGVAYNKGDGTCVVNPPREFIPDLDDVPYPAYHLLDVERYFKNPFVHGFVLSNQRHAQIMSSRGCPYHCVFCHCVFGKKFRKRSPENVVGEIKFLHEKYGVNEIHFEDDSFNVDRVRAEGIFDLIIKSGMKIKISFPNGLRADLLDEKIILKMKTAGVYQVSIGIESADPDIQKTIGKDIDLEKVGRSAQIMSRNGIITNGFFMLGFLDETEEQMLRTIRFAAASPLHLATIHKVNPFPGTVLGEQAKNRGYNIDIRDFGEDGYRFGKINISAVSQQTLDKMQKKAYLYFYLNCIRLWRVFWLTPNKTTLFKHFFRLVFWR
ncbi:MAG TPA: radical SAM protein [Candidatus Omnitrophota bacterium]|nr:radical SAM protein [Candidatus Omnitrophota bacterium]HPS20096.1 radical SAM protein [Candidatus Omnitrophota bacterium]